MASIRYRGFVGKPVSPIALADETVASSARSVARPATSLDYALKRSVFSPKPASFQRLFGQFMASQGLGLPGDRRSIALGGELHVCLLSTHSTRVRLAE
jgi:hypothetical protein